MSFLQTYRREHDKRRSWVLLPTGHQDRHPSHNIAAALVVDEVKQGSNKLINPHCLTLTMRASASITLSVEQLRALLDEVEE